MCSIPDRDGCERAPDRRPALNLPIIADQRSADPGGREPARRGAMREHSGREPFACAFVGGHARRGDAQADVRRCSSRDPLHGLSATRHERVGLSTLVTSRGFEPPTFGSQAGPTLNHRAPESDSLRKAGEPAKERETRRDEPVWQRPAASFVERNTLASDVRVCKGAAHGSLLWSLGVEHAVSVQARVCLQGVEAGCQQVRVLNGPAAEARERTAPQWSAGAGGRGGGRGRGESVVLCPRGMSVGGGGRSRAWRDLL